MENTHSRAMLVKFSARKWLARKKDKRVTSEVQAANKASAKSGNFQKRLIDNKKNDGSDARNEYGELVKIIGAARVAHVANTLAWGKDGDGWRLLPLANLEAYEEAQRSHTREFETRLRDFVLAYPALRNEAKEYLGDMFKESDYPRPDFIGDRFSIEYEPQTLPIFDGAIVDMLSAPQVEDLKKRMEDREHRAVANAIADARQRVGEQVRAVQETMQKTKGEEGFKFTDSKIGNLKDLVATMKRLNFSQDPEFADTLQKIEAELFDFEPQEIRDDASKRKTLAARATSIVNGMGSLYKKEEVTK